MGKHEIKAQNYMLTSSYVINNLDKLPVQAEVLTRCDLWINIKAIINTQWK